MAKAIHVRVLCTKTCSTAPKIVDLVDQIGKTLGIPLSVESVLVSSREQAEKLRCLGSPTVQVDGLDVEPTARGSQAYGLG